MLDSKQLPQVKVVKENVIRIFQSVLDKDQISENDNFFSMGGNSITLARVNLHIFEKYNVRLPFTKLYKNPTASEISAIILEKLPSNQTLN